MTSKEEIENQKNKINNLEKTLQELKKKHEDEIFDLEKLHLIDKDKLKNEMKKQLNELSGEFRYLVYNQMSDCTKKLIQENVDLNSQIRDLSVDMQNLYRENEMLKEKAIFLRN